MVKPSLGRVHASIEAIGGILHVLREGLELRTQRRGVLDEILAAIAQDGALVGAHPSQPEREGDVGDEGDNRDGGSRDRNDPRRAGQVVHRPKNKDLSQIFARRRDRPSAICSRASGIGPEPIAYWNETGKVSVLLSVFFSPGTGTTSAVSV